MQRVGALGLGLGFVVLALLIQLASFGQKADRLGLLGTPNIAQQLVWVISEQSPAAASVFGTLGHFFRFVQVVAVVKIATEFEKLVRIGGQLYDLAGLVVLRREGCSLGTVFRLGAALVHVFRIFYGLDDALPLHFFQDA